MASPVIKIKRSSVQNNAPTAAQLELGELALNTYDGKLFTEINDGTVSIVEIGGHLQHLAVSGISTFASDVALNGNVTTDISIVNTDSDSSAGPILDFYRNSSSAADADYMGQIKFQGENDAGQKIVYAKITGKIQDASDGTEDGLIEFANKKAGSNNITARLRSDSLQLLNGTNFTVAGTSDFTGQVTAASVDVTGVSTSVIHHATGGGYRGTQDAKFDVGFVMDSDNKLYVDYNGYLRNIIGHESSNASIQIGQHNTALIDDIHLKPGTNGHVILNDGTTSSSNTKLATTSTGVNVNGTMVTDNLTVGDYSFPSAVGAEDTVLKVDSGGNLVFGSGSSGGVIPTEKTFTATQGQTVFTDTSTLPTYVQVFINGIKIRPTSDFSKSGSSITLVSAATAGDEIDLVRFD